MKPLLFLLSIVSLSALPPVEVMSGAEIECAKTLWRNQGLYVNCVAGTGSMRPYLDGGETVLGIPFDGRALKVGMLIIFAKWGNPRVIHEVVEVNPANNWFRAKGINNMNPDRWSSPERCKYLVVRVLRKSE